VTFYLSAETILIKLWYSTLSYLC